MVSPDELELFGQLDSIAWENKEGTRKSLSLSEFALVLAAEFLHIGKPGIQGGACIVVARTVMPGSLRDQAMGGK